MAKKRRQSKQIQKRLRMQFPRNPLSALVVCGLLSLSHTACASDRKLFINSTPEGAQVEINGNITCTTPCELPMASTYFDQQHPAVTGHLDQPFTIRLLKDGFIPKDANLTTGPHPWRSHNGRNYFEYYTFAIDHFNFRLDPVQAFLGHEKKSDSTTEALPTTISEALPIEQIVRNTLPAIVQIRAGQYSGSGFFITPAGLVATNAHVVEGQQAVTIITSDGVTLQSNSIYIDHDRDLALVKVEAHNVSFLTLSPSLPLQGAEVIAVGTPGINDVTGTGLLPNSVSKGIISGIRTFSETTVANAPGRAGTWLQTDTTINHGNSGGPLINRSGLVVGINTLGFAGAGTPGINFALASSELIQVVQQRLGVTLGPGKDAAQHSETAADKRLSITSTPSGADIEIDGVFLGNTPTSLSIAEGKRVIRITKKGYQSYERTLQIQPNSSQRISAELDPVTTP